MASDHIHIRITAHPANLKQIRAMTAKVAAAAGLAEKEAGSVILAVDEACSNIIKHCCKNDPTRSIDVTATLDRDSICLVLVDNGKPFDIDSIKPRDIREIKPGGLGVHIIRQVMDVVEYSHTPEGLNQVKLIKKLTPWNF
ncbi:MAG: ATP-binding protein [Desulfobacula sp.]|nr:ATP-binding protein [Desulfobacula sp.]